MGINYSELLDDDRLELDDGRVFNQEIQMARRSNDFYPTPSWATERLLGLFPLTGTVGEPCSGAGDVANVLRRHNKVWTNDIDLDHVADSHYDLTDPEIWGKLPDCDWIVTNPPFKIAAAIVPAAYEKARLGLAMFLRLSYLEPCQNRAQWLEDHPLTKLIVLPRFSFTGNGKSDSCTTAWMVWDKRDDAQTEIIVAT